MAPKDKADAQFTFETIACALAVMDSKGSSLGNKAYELMSKLDGKRSASSFEHQFRAVKARAKELAAELSNESANATTPKSAKKAPASAGKKRSKKIDENENDDDEETVTKTPTKKTKVKKEVEEPSDQDNDGFGINGGFYENAMGPQ